MSEREVRNVYCDIGPLKLLSTCKYCSDIGSGGDCTVCKDFGTVVSLKHSVVNKTKTPKK